VETGYVTFLECLRSALLPGFGSRLLQLHHGAYGVQLMADLGAEVIKVEPLTGDLARTWARLSPARTLLSSLESWKRGIAIDMASDAGRAIVYELAKKATCFARTSAPCDGALANRLSEDREINPRIIYCTSTGFGSKVRLLRVPHMILCCNRWRAVRLNALEKFAGHTAVLPVAVSDYQGAMQVFGGVCAALFHRERTGEGSALKRRCYSDHGAERAILRQGAREAGRQRTRHYPYQLFETSDDVIFVGGATDKFWRSICSIVGMPELATDPRYLSNGQRTKSPRVERAVDSVLQGQAVAEWLASLKPLESRARRYYRAMSFHASASDGDGDESVIEHPAIGKMRVAGVPSISRKRRRDSECSSDARPAHRRSAARDRLRRCRAQ